jgi:hypothetical protein
MVAFFPAISGRLSSFRRAPPDWAEEELDVLLACFFFTGEGSLISGLEISGTVRERDAIVGFSHSEISFSGASCELIN